LLSLLLKFPPAAEQQKSTTITMKAETESVPFNPTEADVVCTKLRTWNTKHPGNLVFNKLIQGKIPSIKNDADFRTVADELIDFVIIQKGARFLKLSDKEFFAGNTPRMCSIMNRKQCLHKVMRSMRTAHARFHGTMTPRSKNKPRKKRSKGYEAKPGDRPIHPHALQLISMVCNSNSKNLAYRVLDKPSPEYTLETEPEKHRLMRLQIRHRFASAKASNMSAIEFSKRLLELWGGTLSRVTPRGGTLSRVTPQMPLPKALEKALEKAKSDISDSSPVPQKVVQDVEAPMGSPFAKSSVENQSAKEELLLSRNDLVKASTTTTTTTTAPHSEPIGIFAAVSNPLVQSASSSVEASYQRDGLISELSTSVPPSEAGVTEGKPLSEEQYLKPSLHEYQMRIQVKESSQTDDVKD
jgi:hypothetical protein